MARVRGKRKLPVGLLSLMEEEAKKGILAILKKLGGKTADGNQLGQKGPN